MSSTMTDIQTPAAPTDHPRRWAPELILAWIDRFATQRAAGTVGSRLVLHRAQPMVASVLSPVTVRCLGVTGSPDRPNETPRPGREPRRVSMSEVTCTEVLGP